MHAAVVLGILPTFNSILLALNDCNQFLGHSVINCFRKVLSQAGYLIRQDQDQDSYTVTDLQWVTYI